MEKQKNVLHRFNVQHVRTLEAAHTAAINLECWENAELYGKELMPGYLYVITTMISMTILINENYGKLIFKITVTHFSDCITERYIL